MFPAGPTSLITKFGYLAVAAIVGLESVGLPLPGEATLITAAAYAGTTQQLNVWLVIASAVAGAVVGDNVGFWLGRELGFRLLIRYGSHVGLNEGRIKVGQYLFQLHGGKIVLFGRFFPVLRIWAAVLAGVNQMAWPKFLLFNAAGAVLWATLYGLGAYYLGHALEAARSPRQSSWDRRDFGFGRTVSLHNAARGRANSPGGSRPAWTGRAAQAKASPLSVTASASLPLRRVRCHS